MLGGDKASMERPTLRPTGLGPDEAKSAGPRQSFRSIHPNPEPPTEQGPGPRPWWPASRGKPRGK